MHLSTLEVLDVMERLPGWHGRFFRPFQSLIVFDWWTQGLRPGYDFVGTRGQDELQSAFLVELQRRGDIEIGNLYLPRP
jgi:hypothetical protein